MSRSSGAWMGENSGERGDIPADEMADFLSATREGKEDVGLPKKATKKAAPARPKAAAKQPPAPRPDNLPAVPKQDPAPPSAHTLRLIAPRADLAPRPPTTPELVTTLLDGAHRADFLALAKWLRELTETGGRPVAVETDQGDVTFQVHEWRESPGFLKLVVDGRSMPFRPREAATMTLRREDGLRLSVTCFASMLPFLGELPYVEVFFIVNEPPPPMDKNARITLGQTPSSVSGKPSDSIDNEEPVAGQEKAASLREPLAKTVVDFDVSREG